MKPTNCRFSNRVISCNKQIKVKQVSHGAKLSLYLSPIPSYHSKDSIAARRRLFWLTRYESIPYGGTVYQLSH